MRDAVAKGIRIGQFNLERILKAFLPSELLKPASRTCWFR